VHSGAFSYINSKVLCYQMQGKVRHHGNLGDWRWYRHENVKFSSISYTYPHPASQ